MQRKFHYQRCAKKSNNLGEKHIIELDNIKLALPETKTAFKAIGIAALTILESKDEEETRKIAKSLPMIIELIED